MRAITFGVVAIALTCVSFCIGIAAEPSNDDKSKNAQSATDNNSKPQGPLAVPAVVTETPAVLVDDKRLESILGKGVQSASGETLGNVTDILVDSDGAVRAAIVDFGGFLGVGVRKIAVAWSALHFVQGKSAITAVLNMNKDQLRVAPEYHAGEPIVIIGAEPKPAQTSTPSKK